MINSWGLFNSTYSLKVRTIFPPGNCVVESGGLAFINRGGRESLGPPPGGMILAQPQRDWMMEMNRPAKRYERSLFMNQSGANLQT
jgi:hypothetical protein